MTSEEVIGSGSKCARRNFVFIGSLSAKAVAALPLLLAVLGMPSLPVHAQSPNYTYEIVAQTGDVIGGKTLTFLGAESALLNDSGAIVFQSYFDAGSGPTSGAGIFTPTSLLAATGDVIAGKALNQATSPALNGSGTVVFRGFFDAGSGPSSGTGIFTPTSLLAATGDVIAGKTLAFTSRPALNDFGTVVFEGFFDAGSGPFSGSGIFTPISLLAATGDVIAGKTLAFPSSPALNDFGTVVFFGFFDAGSGPLSGTGIFTPTSLAAASGDVIGGKLMTQVFSPTLNDLGAVAFQGLFDAGTGPTSGRGIFTPTSVVVANGDNIGGKTILEPCCTPSLNDSGAVAFEACFDGSCFNYGVFTTEEAIAGTGDMIDGATLEGAWGPQINDSGQIAFLAWTNQTDGGCCDPALGYSEYVILATPVDTDAAAPLTTIMSAIPSPAPLNAAVVLTANVDDTGRGDSNISSADYTIDGGSPIPMNASDGTFDEVSENVTASVAPFTVTGVYELCVRGTDEPGNESDPACFLLPVYDPSAGFVTGGGIVNSPAAADLENGATGPARFGFVSKYLPGRSIPDGNLEFQFKAGDINFKSTSMDWLVVTGEPRGRFQGMGTINGGDVCKFVVDAWDASFAPGGVDAFGLRLFACGGASEVIHRYNLPATPLTKGGIIIHRR